jgi:hypothetical protein
MADKVFVGDTVTLTLNTNKVLAYPTLKIKWESPYGIKGNWIATIDPVFNTKMWALVSFNIEGIWKVQAFATDGSEKYHGMWVDVKVYAAIAPDTTAAPTTMVPTTPP